MRYNEQELEEMQYDPQPELVNAYAIGRMQVTLETVARRPGKWVVYHACEVCCPHTDALIGHSESFVAEYNTRDEAYAHIGDDYEFLGVKAPSDWVSDVVQVGDSSEEVPF